MASQVQRRLEFPVKKATRSRQVKKEQVVESPGRAARLSARNAKKNQENMEYRIKPVIESPRKRTSDDEEITTRPPFCTPSPIKKKKEDNFSPIRRDETPCRSSLATKLAATIVSDNTYDFTKQKFPVSPHKTNPVKSSPLKGRAALKRLIDSPKKSPVKNILSSPVKSPVKNILNSPIKGQVKNILSSPVKSPVKSPAKNILSSPIQSPVKTPIKLSSQIGNSPRKAVSSPYRKLNLENPGSHLQEMIESSPSKRKATTKKTQKIQGTPYNQAKQSFHTAKPERLIGRDKETEEVRKFMKGHMTKRTGGSLYISGAPGTGKTAVLTHIIDELKSTHSCKTVYLNCMTLENPSSVYGKLYTDITGKNAPTAKERLRAVEKVLSSEGPSIVMVLDEIDQLDSKNQEILYTVFEWPSLTKSRLVLIGIANALDLTDRILPRLQARPKCKPQLLNFSPYTKDQICAILKDRIQDMEKDGTSIVDPIAIQFCARKISAVAGDMRKALDVCRRAVELVETDMKSKRVLKSRDSINNSPVKQAPDQAKKIGVSHINNVLSEVYGSGAAAQQQETIPLQQKLVVCTLLLMLKQGKTKEVTTGKLHEVYSKICKKRQMAPVDQSEFQGIVTLLESRGMLGVKKGKEARLSKVILKLDEKELEHTMQDKVLVSSILHDGLP